MIDITLPVITDSLRLKWSVEYTGPRLTGPLQVPMLWHPSLQMESGRIYVVDPEYLPSEVRLPKDSMLVCAGSPPRWNYGRDQFPVLSVGCHDLLEVFNAIQKVFDRFRQWACAIDRIAESDADLIAIVKLSLPVFENRIAVLDREFYHLALTETAGPDENDISAWTVRPSPHLPPEELEKYASVFRQYQSYHQQFSPYPGVYTRNLFVGGTREGCVTLDSRHRPLRESDFILFRVLAEKLEKAMARRTVMTADHANFLQSVLRDLLSHNPVSSTRLQQVRKRYGFPEGQYCACLVLYPAADAEEVPAEYFSTMLEKTITQCTATVYEDGITALVLLPDDHGLTQAQSFHLEQFLTDTGLRAGVSNPFSDMRELHMYYRQARCACELGAELTPGGSLYLFSRYALPYMLLNCSGEFPSNALWPPELRRLRDKSSGSGVDYWETFRVYLDNNANIAKTSRDLFLHRSTMLGRLSHIREILGSSMDDPEKQLTYRILMHLLQYEEDRTH